MDLESGLKRQYHASLAMLKDTIEKCPESVWLREGARPAWRIAYHTLFYTHLYLMPDEAAFTRFPGHREEGEDLWEEENRSNANPMTREEVLAYWAVVDGLVDSAVDALDLDAPTCGFHWYTMPKLDHQFVNLRHIMGHTGQLSELLMGEGIDSNWVGGSLTS